MNMQVLKQFIFLAMLFSFFSCKWENTNKTDNKSPADDNTETANTNKNPAEEAGEYEMLFQENTEFASKDDLPMFARLTAVDSPPPVMVLCHQAGSSKDEYKEISTRLAKMGWSSLALDQRSGGRKLGGFNETHQLATQEKKIDRLSRCRTRYYCRN